MENETTETSTSGCGSMILEMGSLSRVTGDPQFESVALCALRKFWTLRISLHLLGTTIDVETGKWIEYSSRIRAGVDSFYEHLLKAHILFGREEFWRMFRSAYVVVQKYFKHGPWYHESDMWTCLATCWQLTSLQAFWPGVQILVGDIAAANSSHREFFYIWQKFGVLPEGYLLGHQTLHPTEKYYPMCLEFAELTFYLYQAIKDPWYLEVGKSIVDSVFIDGLSNSTWAKGTKLMLTSFGGEPIIFVRDQQFQKLLSSPKFFFYYDALHGVAGAYAFCTMWLSPMRGLMSKSKSGSTDDSSMGTGQADNEKRKIIASIIDDVYSALLDMSFLRMVKKEKVRSGMTPVVGTLELWSGDFDSKIEFGQYRFRLLDSICLIASFQPLLDAAKVSEKITDVIKLHNGDLTMVESMHLALENFAASIFDGSSEHRKINNEFQSSLHQTLEDLLQKIISLKWTDPTLVEVLGHYLDALGPFLRYCPNVVASVINKLFELLMSLPFMVRDPSTRTARRARLKICTSFIRLTKASGEIRLPHMRGIASTMSYLQTEGVLLRVEQNLLGEAFLVMASSAGVQQQHEVLLWLLDPLSKRRTQPEWQEAFLTDPARLVHLCAETRFMWSIFPDLHQLFFIFDPGCTHCFTLTLDISTDESTKEENSRMNSFQPGENDADRIVEEYFCRQISKWA